MDRRVCFLIAALVSLGLFSGTLYAAQPAFEGKTIRIVVGFSAGGGFDTYSRAIARHMGKHIPGNPTIIVENMTGAGSIVAANHLYRIAKPDGLTIGNFHGFQVLNQVLGAPGIEFDARKFEWLLDALVMRGQLPAAYRRAFNAAGLALALQQPLFAQSPAQNPAVALKRRRVK